MTQTPLHALREAVEAAAADLGGPGTTPSLERPKKAGFGDYSTNAAMLVGPRLGKPPREVAGSLGDAVAGRLGDRLAKVDVAGPGFLNLFLADAWYADALQGVLDAGSAWGTGRDEGAEKVLVEFVSANPTGPLTAASGRHAAYGDAVARLLEARGHEVGREYYVNDHGTQVQRLGESILARAKGEPVPEDGYQGDYVAEVAAQIPDAATKSVDELAREGVALLRAGAERTLDAYGVRFDRWFSEATLHPDGDERAWATLREAGHLYESEGALWARTTTFGDDKDRVVRRASGEPTYYTADIAYHLDKYERGYARLIDVLGADHHGYIGRLKAAVQTVGRDPESLEVAIMQLVNIVERGERTSMSKRRGEFVTLDELVQTIGADACRFLMLQRSHDTPVDVDLDLARKQERENPVYYVQMMHARCASIRAKAAEAGGAEGGERSVPWEDDERALVKRLVAFPAEVETAAEKRAPHRIAVYALELAQDLSGFYERCRVLGSGAGVEGPRLALVAATQQTLAAALGLLGVSAPDRM